MQDVISVHNLGKRFRRYHKDHALTLKETALRGFRRTGPEECFWALKDISFSVRPGRMLGIIGPNGAGKSTLLRLIGGIGRPDEGSVRVSGRVGALLELGAGFHPELTGRENVFVAGVIAGLTRQEVARRLDSVVSFAELEDFIDNPLRTYSTGMQMRLAFSVATHTDPDILLIDEVLAVGDVAFQRKCLNRIAQFRSEGCAILFVTHEPGSVREMCDEVLWLRSGRIAAHGPVDVVVTQYVQEMSAETRRRTPASRPPTHNSSNVELQVNRNRFGSLEIEIADVRLLDGLGRQVSELTSGDSLAIEIAYVSYQSIPSPIFGVTITREDGTVCCDVSTATGGVALPELQGPGWLTLHLDRLDLAAGSYYVDVGVYERDWTYAYDYHWRVYPLTIQAAHEGKGILRPPSRWDLSRVPEQPAGRPFLGVS